MVARDRFPKLLQCPVCSQMRSHVVMDNAPTPHLHCKKNTEHMESHCHRNQKIAGDNSVSMIPEERTPVLRRGSGARSPV